MFIGGLNWDTTDGRYTLFNPFLICSTKSIFIPFPSSLYIADTLRDYFSQFGKVDACTIMRDAAGRSRCFAFLTFDDPASVNAVMVREHILDGKIVSTCMSICTGAPLFMNSLFADRPKTRYSAPGTPTGHKALHRRSRRNRDIRVYA